MLRKIRLTLAVIFFVLITLLFMDFTGTLHLYFGWMAKIQFLPALLALNVGVILFLIVLTLIFGRIYCSVVCPMGVMQDVFAWIGKKARPKKERKIPYAYSPAKSVLRYSVLGVFVLAIIGGVGSFVALLAPYSSYGRIASNLLQPLYRWGNNLLASIAEHYESYAFYDTDVWMKSLPTFVIAVLTLVIVGYLAYRNGRTYCNTICPVGTTLGYVAKFSLLKMKVDEDRCVKCGLCEKNCKAACIKVERGEPVKFDYTRCVTCGNCQTVCGKKALHYGRWKKGNGGASHRGEAEEGAVSRRSFLSITGTAVVAATLKAQEKTTDGGLAVVADKKIPERKTPLTPAGSLSARNLQQHCTACQLCVANCPNGVLRPSESLEHFLQPEMQYDKGYCRPECTRCSNVCPTGAIRPVTPDDKLFIQIGHAVWVKQNCIPLTDQKTCGNCAKHCPAGAIQMVPVDKSLKQDPESGGWMDADGNPVNERDKLKIPVVNAEECIGCGTCENLCPARPFSAIYVEGHEVHKEV